MPKFLYTACWDAEVLASLTCKTIANNKIMKKTINIACKGAGVMSIKDMTYFQGDLKTLTKENYEKLKKEIVETGYAYPIKVWTDKSEGKRYICGGHQTYRVLTQMETEGYEIPKVPVVDIYAKDFFEAKRRVLQDITQYGTVERQGLYEFMTHANIPIEDLEKSFIIPQVSLDMPSFRAEFFHDSSGDREVSFTAKSGSKELSEGEFSNFDHQCPKCGFEFNKKG